MTRWIYPLTRMLFANATSHTSLNLARLSSIKQLILALENPSLAAPKIATSVAPAWIAALSPFKLGTRTGNVIFSFWGWVFRKAITSAESDN
jgi:hypothetical protein